MFSPSLESQLQKIDRLTPRSQARIQVRQAAIRCEWNLQITTAIYNQHDYSDFNGYKRQYVTYLPEEPEEVFLSLWVTSAPSILLL